MTSSELTREQCLELADKLFIDKRDLSLYVIDTSEEKIYKFLGRGTISRVVKSQESITTIEEEIVSDISYSQLNKYESNSRYEEITPITIEEIHRVVGLYVI